VAKGSRTDMADLVSREDLADQGVRKVAQAYIKQGFLVVLGKVTGVSRRNARRTANTSRKVIRPCVASNLSGRSILDLSIPLDRRQANK
jgi:hypothetical protein